MAEFVNVKIIGVDPVSAATNVIARSSTGNGTSGASWQLLNVHSLGNLWVNSLSGGVFASMTASVASAGTVEIGTFANNSASSVALTAVAFLKVASDNGQIWAIPLLKTVMS